MYKLFSSRVLLGSILIAGFLLFATIAISMLAIAGDKENQAVMGTSAKDRSDSTATVTAVQLFGTTWHGRLAKNETKQLEINLLFPYEGTFYIEAKAAAYDKTIKRWLGGSTYALNVTTKKSEEADVQRTYTRPKVEPVNITGQPGIKATWEDMVDPDSLNQKEQHRVIDHPPAPGPINLDLPPEKQSVWLEMSFASKPKIAESVKLMLTVFAPSDFDSVAVDFKIPREITVISSRQSSK